MSMRITDTEMTSDETVHRAELTSSGKWAVSWLPGRLVDRSQATTAMVIAETVAVMVEENADCTHRKWWHLDDWAAELGLTGPEAMARVTEPEVAQDAPDPGPVPAVVEPETTGHVTTIDVNPHVQVVVEAGHGGFGQVGLTMRGPHASITTALAAPAADAVAEALATATPVPYVPAVPDGGEPASRETATDVVDTTGMQYAIEGMATRLAWAYEAHADAAYAYGPDGDEQERAERQQRAARAISRQHRALHRLIARLQDERDQLARLVAALTEEQRDVQTSMAAADAEVSAERQQAEDFAVAVAAALESRHVADESYHDHHLLNRIADALSDYDALSGHHAAADRAGGER